MFNAGGEEERPRDRGEDTDEAEAPHAAPEVAAVFRALLLAHIEEAAFLCFNSGDLRAEGIEAAAAGVYLRDEVGSAGGGKLRFEGGGLLLHQPHGLAHTLLLAGIVLGQREDLAEGVGNLGAGSTVEIEERGIAGEEIAAGGGFGAEGGGEDFTRLGEDLFGVHDRVAGEFELALQVCEA